MTKIDKLEKRLIAVEIKTAVMLAHDIVNLYENFSHIIEVEANELLMARALIALSEKEQNQLYLNFKEES